MSKRSLYIVCKTLDQPIRVIGLPLDEFIISALLGGIFILMGKLIISFVVGILTVILLRMIKRGQGAGWLLNLLYWYLPKNMTKAFIRHTPSSVNREWIS